MPARINRVSLAEVPSLSELKAERRENARATENGSRDAALALQSQLPHLRKQEAQAEEKRLKEKDRRIRADVANLKVDPIDGRAPHGALIKVDRNSGPGHLLALHRQNPNVWTKPMVDAAGRFGRDYDIAENSGLSGTDFEPKVDTCGKIESSAVGIVASSRLRDLKTKIGPDAYAILVLVCGVGFTFTELHANGLGDKRSLSDQLRVALNKCAAFYGMSKDEGMSGFLRRATDLIDGLKNRA